MFSCLFTLHAQLEKCRLREMVRDSVTRVSYLNHSLKSDIFTLHHIFYNKVNCCISVSLFFVTGHGTRESVWYCKVLHCAGKHSAVGFANILLCICATLNSQKSFHTTEHFNGVLIFWASGCVRCAVMFSNASLKFYVVILSFHLTHTPNVLMCMATVAQTLAHVQLSVAPLTLCVS